MALFLRAQVIRIEVREKQVRTMSHARHLHHVQVLATALCSVHTHHDPVEGAALRFNRVQRPRKLDGKLLYAEVKLEVFFFGRFDGQFHLFLGTGNIYRLEEFYIELFLIREFTQKEIEVRILLSVLLSHLEVFIIVVQQYL